MQLEFVVDS